MSTNVVKNPTISSNSNIIKIQFESSVDTQDSFKSFTRKKRNKKSRNKKIKEKRNNKFKYTKDNKICHKIFNDFKICDEFYSEFHLFHKIEKNIKNNTYTHYSLLSNDIRNIFNHYFRSYSDIPEFYCKIFNLSEKFERLYKEYDNKHFIKESKNIIDIKKRLNKIKREIKATCFNQSENQNKFKINVLEGNKHSVRKFKIDLINKVKELHPEQKKGIISIISNNYLDMSNSNILKIDFNKIPVNQLKEIERYVNKCYEKEDEGNHAIKGENDEEKKEDVIFEGLSVSISSEGEDSSSDI